MKTRDYITSYTLSKLPQSMRQKYDEFMREGTLAVMEGTVLDMMEVYDDLDAFIEQSRYDVRIPTMQRTLWSGGPEKTASTALKR